MDTWVWLVIIAVVAAAVLALVWWSSGRARPRGRGPVGSLTQEQSETLSLNQIRNRGGNPPAPF